MAATRIGVDQEVIQRALSEQRTAPSDPEGIRTSDRRLPGHVKVEREALQLLLVRTKEAIPLLEGISAEEFTSNARRELFAAAIARDQQANFSEVSTELSPEALSLMTELTVGFVDIPAEDLEFRVQEVFGRLRLFNLERAIKTRRNTLQDVNPLEHPLKHDELFTELVGLEAERRDLLRSMETTG